MGLKGLQIIYSAGGAQMSGADPGVWHVTGKPGKYNTSSVGALCIISNDVKWSKS
jgi:hypothetical protein